MRFVLSPFLFISPSNIDNKTPVVATRIVNLCTHSMYGKDDAKIWLNVEDEAFIRLRI